MPAPVLTCNYEELQQVEGQLDGLYDRLLGMNGSITAQLEELRSNFEGEAADKFFDEMDSSVVPRIGRLLRAVESIRGGVGRVTNIISQAEEEAGSLFR